MTVLVAVSRAHTRNRVLDMGIRLGEAFGREVHIVHLIEGEGGSTDPSQIREELREYVLAENAVATVAVERVEPTLGRPAKQFGEKLLEVATEIDASHIVVGHTPQGVLDDVTRGTTAMTVADAAPVPVTVIPNIPEEH
ncbi:MAG: universal stress protein [Haloarculaceae archaeon]